MNGKPEAFEARTDSEWASTPDYIWIENPDELRAYARTLRDKCAAAEADQLTIWYPDFHGGLEWLEEGGDTDALAVFTDPGNAQLQNIQIKVGKFDFTLTSLFRHSSEEVFAFLTYDEPDGVGGFEADAARYTPEQ